MNSKKRCMINFFSVGREDYKKGTERLIASALKVKLDADVIIHSPDFTENASGYFTDGNELILIKGYPVTKKYGECKPHKEAPYQFKSFCFQHALELGYEQILWCDSSVVLFKNPEHYWELAKEIGIILFDNQGCTEAAFTSDDCLEHMGCDKEWAKTWFQCDAGIMLLDFNFWKTPIVFNEYMEHCLDGICLKGASKSLRPEYHDHRHDQSILSYVAKKNYINFINYGGWAYGGDPVFREGKYHPTFAKVGVLLVIYTNENGEIWVGLPQNK